jgi:hypothetical protein
VDGAPATRGGVAWPKTTVEVEMQGLGSNGGGTILHNDRVIGGGVGRQPHEEGLEQDQ